MKVMFVSAVIVVIDQITKAVTRSTMMLGESKPVIKNFFHFTYVTNDGMAFGSVSYTHLTLPTNREV